MGSHYLSHLSSVFKMSSFSKYQRLHNNRKTMRRNLLNKPSPLGPRTMSGYRRRLASTPIGSLSAELNLEPLFVESDASVASDMNIRLQHPRDRTDLPVWFWILAYVWVIVTATMLIRSGLKAFNRRVIPVLRNERAEL